MPALARSPRPCPAYFLPGCHRLTQRLVVGEVDATCSGSLVLSKWNHVHASPNEGPARGLNTSGKFPQSSPERAQEYPFKLADVRKLGNGDVQFNVFADPDSEVEIRATSDFQIWDVLDTITLDSVPTLFTDTTAGSFDRRIYQGATDEPE